LRSETAAIGDARSAAGEATNSVRQTGEATARLGRSVGDSSAAIEQMVSSITLVAGNIGGIADTVNTVSSAIAELAVSINAVAGNAQEANTLSLQADTKARDGGKAVERLVESTREIATDINGVVVKMEELGTASERIGDIVEVIDTIADQTNLLALNAAIEAARAGEHGRGFAVVADEVRKLAENSARSTREIGQLVKDIQAKIVEVIHSFTISGGKAESGLEMADLAGRAITDILGAVAQASRLIEQISVAAREQAAGSSAIVNSVEQMNNLMREAARSLDEQNTSNQQMITTITAMQQLTDAVTNGVALQRSACDRIDAAAKLLVSTSDASKTASVGIDDLAKSLRERVNVIVSDVHPKSTPELAHAGFVRLATGRN
jgi:methyl-accepting chemotaxis protein